MSYSEETFISPDFHFPSFPSQARLFRIYISL
jgi:hypothetical protein